MTYFITFEGPEGSGKSTVIKHIYEYLSQSQEVLMTREPGGISVSEKIREIVLGLDMDSHTEALLFAASRSQHLVEKVLPALEAGQLVLCDRFVDSSLVYQGFARGIGMEQVKSINEFAIRGRMPDLTIYLKIDPEIGLARIAQNKRDSNRLDKESMDFHNKVVLGYNKLSENNPERIKVIDANQDLDKVIEDAKTQINKFLTKR
jgi:dTMP kinase